MTHNMMNISADISLLTKILYVTKISHHIVSICLYFWSFQSYHIIFLSGWICPVPWPWKFT